MIRKETVYKYTKFKTGSQAFGDVFFLVPNREVVFLKREGGIGE